MFDFFLSNNDNFFTIKNQMGIIITNVKKLSFSSTVFCHIISHFNFYVYCLPKQTNVMSNIEQNVVKMIENCTINVSFQ